MKKTFWPRGALFNFCVLLCLAVLCMSIYVIVIAVLWHKYFVIFFGLIGIAIPLHTIIANYYNRIIFYKEKLIVKGQLLNKNEKVQFKDELNYDEIVGVALIEDIRNSKKQRRKALNINIQKPFLYFEFVLSNEKTKWIFISFFSKKQREKMLSIINSKTNLNLSYDQLKRQDYSIFKRKKKQEKDKHE